MTQKITVMIRVQHFFSVVLFSVLLVSCGKEKEELIKNPEPTEPELITTVRIKATKVSNQNDMKTFRYKVENGFHGTPTNIQADMIVLDAGSIYSIEMFVLDEKSTPTIDVTQEIIEEKNSHLFYYKSTPEKGAGSISTFDKDKDGNGQDFARVCKWQTGASGNGELKITLIHGPRNKEAPTRETIAGATDAEAVFVVKLN